MLSTSIFPIMMFPFLESLKQASSGMRKHPKQKGLLKKKRKVNPLKPMHLTVKLKSDSVDLQNMQDVASATSISYWFPEGGLLPVWLSRLMKD